MQLLFFYACSPQLPQPTIVTFSPTVIVANTPTLIDVGGENFFPELHILSKEELAVNQDVQVWLIDEENNKVLMEEPNWVDDNLIQFLTTTQLEVGDHQIEIEWADGRTAQSDESIKVNATPLAGVKWISFESNYQTDEWALAQLQAVDNNGLAFADNPFVSIHATKPLEFRSGLLVQQTETQNGIQGYLPETGLGFVAFTSQSSTIVDLEVEMIQPVESIDSITISFSAGEATQTGVSLSPDGPYVAGQSVNLLVQLLDESATPTSGEKRLVVIEEACSEQNQIVEILDTEVVSFQLTTASTPICQENQFIIKDVFTNDVLGSSEYFEVAPNAPYELDVLTVQNIVQAGQMVDVFVRLHDMYSNTITTDDLVIDTNFDQDTILSLSCSDFTDGLAYCSVVFSQVVEGYRLYLATGDDVFGYSAPLSVLPSEASYVTISTPNTTVNAGDEFDVFINITDAFGNDLTVADDSVFSLKSNQTEVPCSKLPPSNGALLKYRCAITEARTHTIIAQYYTATGELNNFNVLNGPLNDVTLISSPPNSVAGTAISVTVDAVDQYGNPFLTFVQSNIELAVNEDLIQSVIESNGSVTWSWTPTVAEVIDPLVVYQGNSIRILQSIHVVAASPDTLEIIPEKTWGELGVPLNYRVVLRDAFGNDAIGVSDITVIRTSDGHLINETTLQNEGVYPYTATEVRVGEQLSVSSPIFPNAVSFEFDNMNFCSSNTPLVISTPTEPDSVICIDDNPIEMEVSFQTPTIHYSVNDIEWTRTSNLSPTFSVIAGAQNLEILAIDEQNCFSTATYPFYGAPNRLEAFGLIEIGLATNSLDPTLQPTTQLDINAYRCDDTPASFESLLLRTTAGNLETMNGLPLNNTGIGQNINLDAAGEASIRLNIDGNSKYDAQVFVGKADESAGTAAAFFIDSWLSAPTVIDFIFEENSGFLGDVRIEFDQDMDATTITASDIDLLDSNSQNTTATELTWLSSRTLSVNWNNISMSSGPFYVNIPSSLTNIFGTAIEGIPQSANTDFEGLIDANETELDTINCTSSLPLFHPDGDNSSGPESDSVSLISNFNGVPTYVLWQITGGDYSFSQIFTGTGTNHSDDFYGRDENGVILADGTYTISILGLGESYVSGAPCAVSVSISNRIQDWFPNE